MRPVIRLVCADCLRSIESAGTNGAEGSTNEPCPHCGGPIEAVWEDPSDEYTTPLSLALTPEETPPWLDSTPLSSTASMPQVPKQVGRYEVREFLGGGGFGQVYRAYDPRLDRDVALKVLRDVHPTARVIERFFREARSAAQLDHPNIVPLHDAGRDGGRCWIAYQYVEGRALNRTQDSTTNRTDPREVVRIVRALADALDHAHRRGVVHRDVKPANVIVEPTGRPRLTDFGLARRLDHDATLTVEGAILGTPAYMSPEQAAGRGHTADARSDVYSLGVMLYELLSGTRPANLPSGAPAWRAELLRPPRSFREQGCRVSLSLERICFKALALDPSERFPDARSLAVALSSWLDRPPPRAWFVRSVFLTAGVVGGLGLGQVGNRFVSVTGPVAIHQDRPAPVPPQTGNPTEPLSHIHIEIPSRRAGLVVSEKKGGPGLYHRPDCGFAHLLPTGQRIEFASPDEARSQGLWACGVCFSMTKPSPPDAGPDQSPTP